MKLPAWLSPTAIILASLPFLHNDANGQPPSSQPVASECIVVLKTPNPEFGEIAEREHFKVLGHSSSNSNWWLRSQSSDCSSFRALAQVDFSAPSSSVIVTIREGEALPEKDVEKLGGIVVRKFTNISAASVVLPIDKVSILSSLPGIERVRKDRSVSANVQPSTMAQ